VLCAAVNNPASRAAGGSFLTGLTVRTRVVHPDTRERGCFPRGKGTLLPAQIGNGDRDRRSAGAADEDHVVHLPAQGAKRIDCCSGVTQPQTGQVGAGQVADTAACGPDRHHEGKELRFGPGQMQ
jgi:hypothetical protein